MERYTFALSIYFNKIFMKSVRTIQRWKSIQKILIMTYNNSFSFKLTIPANLCQAEIKFDFYRLNS